TGIKAEAVSQRLPSCPPHNKIAQSRHEAPTSTIPTTQPINPTRSRNITQPLRNKAAHHRTALSILLTHKILLPKQFIFFKLICWQLLCDKAIKICFIKVVHYFYFFCE